MPLPRSALQKDQDAFYVGCRRALDCSRSRMLLPSREASAYPAGLMEGSLSETCKKFNFVEMRVRSDSVQGLFDTRLLVALSSHDHGLDPFAPPPRPHLPTTTQSSCREECRGVRPRLSCIVVQRATSIPEVTSHHEVCANMFVWRV